MAAMTRKRATSLIGTGLFVAIITFALPLGAAPGPSAAVDNSAEASAGLVLPKIDRKPDPGSSTEERPMTALWQAPKLRALPGFNPDSTGPFQVDLRCRDASGLDLQDRLADLIHACFDERTVWPPEDRLPKGFDYKAILEKGKNPGLHVRDLHKRGITGRGVAIAIIDNPLLVDHQEYADRLRFYEEIDVKGAPAHMHGAAVTSIAVGRTVGVAPEAEVYYVATWPLERRTDPTTAPTRPADQGEMQVSLRYRVQAVRRILEINEVLPADKKIRVISMSMGWSAGTPYAQEMDEAMQEAKRKGLLVMCSNTQEVHGFRFNGLGREPMADPDDVESYGPGRFWEGDFRRSGLREGCLLVPMDSRATASQTGQTQYAFYADSGWSWAIPYIAGLYALAVQADGRITPETFWALALRTGRTVKVAQAGTTQDLGLIVDPGAIVAAMEKGYLSDKASVARDLAKLGELSRSEPTSEANPAFRQKALSAIPRIEIGKSTRQDVIGLLGKPTAYMWGSSTFQESSLPDIYIMAYPDKLQVLVEKDSVEEIRIENPGYTFGNAIHVGSTLEDMLDVLGPPTQTVTGGKNEFKDGVLYRDIEGKKGYCYYSRSDLGVRVFLLENRVAGLYLFRSQPASKL